MVELIERINSLLRQDRTLYKCEDYLNPSYQEDLEATSPSAVPVPASSNSSTVSSSSSSTTGITEAWREKICEWSFQVVDHFDFSREIVSVSTSIFDRYLSNKAVDKRQFQLAAMVCLYLTIKIYERKTLSIDCMVDLGKGVFSREQMTAMEMAILETLSWHVHPPTSICMTSHLLHLLPASTACSASMRHDVLELARFLTELSVIDYFFVDKETSSVALAALLNAMDGVRGFPLSSKAEFLDQLTLVDNLDPTSPEVEECRSRLRELYAQGGYPATSPTAVSEEIQVEQEQPRVETTSPVCVAEVYDMAQHTNDSCGDAMPPQQPPIYSPEAGVPNTASYAAYAEAMEDSDVL